VRPEPATHRLSQLRSIATELFWPVYYCFSVIACSWLDVSLSSRCSQVVRCHRAICCHAGLERVGGVRSAGEKSLKTPCHGWDLNEGHGEDRQLLPRSYHDWLYYTNLVIAYSCSPWCRAIGVKVPIHPLSFFSLPACQETNNGLEQRVV